MADGRRTKQQPSIPRRRVVIVLVIKCYGVYMGTFIARDLPQVAPPLLRKGRTEPGRHGPIFAFLFLGSITIITTQYDIRRDKRQTDGNKIRQTDETNKKPPQGKLLPGIAVVDYTLR